MFLVPRAVANLFKGIIGNCLDLWGDTSFSFIEPWIRQMMKV